MRLKTICWIAGVNLYISAFTFGGGYVVIPMIRKFFVEKRNLFGEDELMDMAAIAQSSPGAIAVNLAVLAGYRVAGMAGATVSCLAAVTPAVVILSIVSLFYAAFRDSPTVAAALVGMQAGVAAIIVDLVVDMFRAIAGRRHMLSTLLAPAAFLASVVFRVNVAAILAVCAGVAIVETLWKRKERDADDMGTAG